MRPAPRPNGFTLLELLCVVGMLATLLAIAIPKVSVRVPELLLDQAARSLAADVRLARVKAVARNTRVRVLVDVEGAGYDVRVERDGVFSSEGGGRSLPGSVRFDRDRSSRIVGGRVSITFQPRGHTADNSTIALAAGGSGRRVIVSAAGRVRVE